MWNYFIVWTRSKEKLRKISAYYNRVNHFSSFKTTWSTNILAARFIWTELGFPVPPKIATALGTVVRQGKDVENDSKYKVISVSSSPAHMIQLESSRKSFSRLLIQVHPFAHCRVQ